MESSDRLARALGLFSVGLGTVQVIAPRRVSDAIGAPGGQTPNLVARAVGLRELSVAMPLLMRRRPVAWTWLRVAGDAMDLALLAAAMRDRRAQRDRLTLALAA